MTCLWNPLPQTRVCQQPIRATATWHRARHRHVAPRTPPPRGARSPRCAQVTEHRHEHGHSNDRLGAPSLLRTRTRHHQRAHHPLSLACLRSPCATVGVATSTGVKGSQHSNGVGVKGSQHSNGVEFAALPLCRFAALPLCRFGALHLAPAHPRAPVPLRPRAPVPLRPRTHAAAEPWDRLNAPSFERRPPRSNVVDSTAPSRVTHRPRGRRHHPQRAADNGARAARGAARARGWPVHAERARGATWRRRARCHVAVACVGC